MPCEEGGSSLPGELCSGGEAAERWSGGGGGVLDISWPNPGRLPVLQLQLGCNVAERIGRKVREAKGVFGLRTGTLHWSCRP